MQRYDLKDYQVQEDYSDVLKESKDGYWVKFEDVVTFSNTLIEDTISATGKLISPILESVGCNCAEMSNRKRILKVDEWNWICPSHGYKKL